MNRISTARSAMPSLSIVLLILVNAAAAGELPWSNARFLNDESAKGDVSPDVRPDVASDGAGVWLAVWQTESPVGLDGDSDILASRSVDDGQTWSASFPLNDAGTDTGNDEMPRVATDGNGTWVVVWHSSEGIAGSGGDSDIIFVRSTDDGATWTAPGTLNNRAALDTSLDADQSPVVVYAGGVWACLWQSSDPSITMDGGRDFDILYSLSNSGGAAWSAAAPVDDKANGENANDTVPTVASNGAGTWVAVWSRSRLFDEFDLDLLHSVSLDNGATWSSPTLAFDDGDSLENGDGSPSVYYGAGTWSLVFSSTSDRDGKTGSDADLFVTQTTAPLLGFGTPVLANSNGNMDSESDYLPRITGDGLGTLAIVYARSDGAEPLPGGADMVTFASHDNGMSWGVPKGLGPNPDTDLGIDTQPAVANDGAETWIAVWSTTNDLTNQSGGDNEIAFSRSDYRADVQVTGTLFDNQTLLGISCAALEVTNRDDTSIGRIVTTDASGRFEAGGLPPGTYRVRMRPVGYPERIRNVELATGQTRVLNVGFPPAAEGVVALFGTVTDFETGARLPGVKVTAATAIRTRVTYTCSQGRYEFTLEELFGSSGSKQSGNVDLDFEAEGYDPASNNAEVPEEGGTMADQTMSKLAGPGTLAGIVVGGVGAGPLPDALITLGGSLNVSDTTGANGTYLFDSLPAGNYSVHVSKSGYSAQSVNVPVHDGGVAAQNFTLEEEDVTGILPGDINGDGVVDAVDVQLAINSVLGTVTVVDADVNDDEATDAVDIQLVINAALGV